MPEVRGTTDFMAEPIVHPKRSPRTPSRRSSFFAANERTETDSLTLSGADTACASF